MVYKTPYAKNPFDAITDQELDQYKREVERKQKGDICTQDNINLLSIGNLYYS